MSENSLSKLLLKNNTDLQEHEKNIVEKECNISEISIDFSHLEVVVRNYKLRSQNNTGHHSIRKHQSATVLERTKQINISVDKSTLKIKFYWRQGF